MEDSRIIELFFARDEKAISETHGKYGRYCYSIAYNILAVNEDCEECVNDTLMKAWNAIPPQKPKKLSAFLGRITRNLEMYPAVPRYNLQIHRRSWQQFSHLLQ